jgi:hypothetical protein
VIEHDALPEAGDRTWVLMFSVESESPESVRLAVSHLRDEVVPASGAQAGSKGAFALADSSGRRALAMTLWDSIESLAAAGRPDQELREAVPGLEVDVERFELVAEERPG